MAATATKPAAAANGVKVLHQRDVDEGNGNIQLTVTREGADTYATFRVKLTRAIGRPKSATHGKGGVPLAEPKERVLIASNRQDNYLVSAGDMYWALNISAKGSPDNWPPKP